MATAAATDRPQCITYVEQTLLQPILLSQCEEFDIPIPVGADPTQLGNLLRQYHHNKENYNYKDNYLLAAWAIGLRNEIHRVSQVFSDEKLAELQAMTHRLYIHAHYVKHIKGGNVNFSFKWTEYHNLLSQLATSRDQIEIKLQIPSGFGGFVDENKKMLEQELQHHLKEMKVDDVIYTGLSLGIACSTEYTSISLKIRGEFAHDAYKQTSDAGERLSKEVVKTVKDTVENNVETNGDVDIDIEHWYKGCIEHRYYKGCVYAVLSSDRWRGLQAKLQDEIEKNIIARIEQVQSCECTITKRNTFDASDDSHTLTFTIYGESLNEETIEQGMKEGMKLILEKLNTLSSIDRDIVLNRLPDDVKDEIKEEEETGEQISIPNDYTKPYS